MKFTSAFIAVSALCTTVQSAAIPDGSTSLSLWLSVAELVQPGPESRLEKRKGGGGGRSSGSSSSSSSSSSSGGRTSGSSSSSSGSTSGSSGSSSSSSSGRTSSSSNLGGATSAGSGVRPSYGGGAYYGGGARVPYSSGGRSPGGISPIYFAAPALAFAGVYAYGAYMYPYNHYYSFHNRSQPTNSTNTTLPVSCICQQYSVCGCDNNTDSSYLAQLVGNGSVSDMNSTLVRVADINGTSTLLVNGTLPNGTTASGGSDSDSSTTSTTGTSAAGSLKQSLVESSGFYLLVAGVGYTVWFM